jgi:hypothetical protein
MTVSESGRVFFATAADAFKHSDAHQVLLNRTRRPLLPTGLVGGRVVYESHRLAKRWRVAWSCNSEKPLALWGETFEN